MPQTPVTSSSFNINRVSADAWEEEWAHAMADVGLSLSSIFMPLSPLPFVQLKR
jgi:hypothetical protein